jgi:hypothetical protein
MADMDYWSDSIMVCVDCMHAEVNGEMTDDLRKDPWSEIPEHWQVALDFDPETDEGHDHFSTRDCDACGDPLAGERFRFVVRETERRETPKSKPVSKIK